MQAGGEETKLCNLGSSTRLTAVGIDNDKNSHQAVKWAVDHLLINSPSLILVHVRNKPPVLGFAMTEPTPDAAKQQIESETAQFFMPYRGFCSRKGIQLIEVVLEDADVPKALNEFITTQHIHNFVLGATSRNALAKKFWNHPDVASTMVKTAPDFCAVYVISKGKAVTVRSAKGPMPAKPADATDPDGFVRTPSANGSRRRTIPSPFPLPLEQMKPPVRERPPFAANLSVSVGHLQHESIDLSHRLSRTSSRTSLSSRDFADDLHFQGGLNFQPGSDFSMVQESVPLASDCSGDSSPNSKHELEVEMKRLKLELKQTMDMYSNASKIKNL